MGCPEHGYVGLFEHELVRGPLRLAVERDLYFEADKPLSAYTSEARTERRIVT